MYQQAEQHHVLKDGRPKMLSQMMFGPAPATQKFFEIKIFSLQFLILIRSNKQWKEAWTVNISSASPIGALVGDSRAPLLRQGSSRAGVGRSTCELLCPWGVLTGSGPTA
jgi:hypothetical protein